MEVWGGVAVFKPDFTRVDWTIHTAERLSEVRGEEEEVRCNKTETEKNKRIRWMFEQIQKHDAEQQNSRLSCFTYKKNTF